MPKSMAVANVLQDIQNEAAIDPIVPVVAGLGALQEQMNANHLQVLSLLKQLQGQMGGMQSKIDETEGQIRGMQGRIGQMERQIRQVQNELLCLFPIG